MASLITVAADASTISPALVLGYETSRESQNIVHDIIGGGIALTLVKPRPRSGTLRLFFLTEADAFDALQKHSQESTFSLTDSDRPSVQMTYALGDGQLDLELTEGRTRWVLSVPYQELDAATSQTFEPVAIALPEVQATVVYQKSDGQWVVNEPADGFVNGTLRLSRVGNAVTLQITIAWYLNAFTPPAGSQGLRYSFYTDEAWGAPIAQQFRPPLGVTIRFPGESSLFSLSNDADWGLTLTFLGDEVQPVAVTETYVVSYIAPPVGGA